jgi:hypothetical protein
VKPITKFNQLIFLPLLVLNGVAQTNNLYDIFLAKTPAKANPTLQQRVEWHIAHQKKCSCRPILGKAKCEKTS